MALRFFYGGFHGPHQVKKFSYFFLFCVGLLATGAIRNTSIILPKKTDNQVEHDMYILQSELGIHSKSNGSVN